MKKIIHKSFFKNYIIEGEVPSTKISSINEFKLGKNFFYEVVNNKKLLSLHKQLNDVLLNKIDLNNAAVAFRKDYSYLHLFEPHKTNYYFLRLDIRSFFHSIRVEDIKEIFKAYISEDEYIDDKKKQSILEGFINLVTYTIPADSKNDKFKEKQVLPMGFTTSPVISNIIFRKLDIQIQKFCSKNNIIYTRYADDMLFSSSLASSFVHSESFIKEIRITISQMKFQLNENKTIRTKHTISLNGYTIQYSYFENFFKLLKQEYKINEVRLSNKKTNIIKDMIYLIEVKKMSSQQILWKLFHYKLRFKFVVARRDVIKKYYDDQLLNKISGYRSYLLSMIKFNKKYSCTRDETIQKYSELIDKLDKIIVFYDDA